MEKSAVYAFLGGTFNPIHNGHISIAIKAHEQFNIDKIVVMPSFMQAYKNNNSSVSANDRCNMVSLAIKDYDYMELSRMEIDRQGYTYTADTLEALQEQYETIYFLIGADSLFSLDSWRKPEYICSHCHLLVANRDNASTEELNRAKDNLVNKYNAKIDFINGVDIPISSSKLREMIKNHEDISDYVSKDVKQYIEDNKLYLE